MRATLNLAGGALFVIWIIEYFGYNGGEKTHVVLLAAIVVFLIKTIIYLPVRGKI
jgi:hypothetical protein